MLEYAFMQKALISGLVLAVCLPCIGVTIVLKRLSMTGDALSHCSLAGVAAGLITGINPVVGALLACVGASLGVEYIRSRIPRYAEISLAVISALGMGLAGVLSGFTGNSSNLNSFLFGSIVSVSVSEVILVVVLGVCVLGFTLLFRRSLLTLALDEGIARTSGVPVTAMNVVFSLIVAVVVAIAARTVGALIVSSMLVIPVACAMQWAKSYKTLMGLACGVAVVSTLLGLTASFYWGFKPGGSIILIEVALLVISLIIQHVRERRASRA